MIREVHNRPRKLVPGKTNGRKVQQQEYGGLPRSAYSGDEKYCSALMEKSHYVEVNYNYQWMSMLDRWFCHTGTSVANIQRTPHFNDGADSTATHAQSRRRMACSLLCVVT